MSEIAQPTAPVESTSTTEAAEQVLDAFEQTETTGSDTGDTTGTEPVPDTAAAVPEPPKTLSEVEQLLHAEGFTEERRVDGRENRIPYSKVKKIIENGLKKGRADFDTRYGTVETEAKTLRGYIDSLRTSVQGDPRAHLSELARLDARYRAFLEPQTAAPSPASGTDDRPKPDVDLGNGQWTYSPDGVEQLTAWKAQQLLDARLKPWEERDKAAQAKAKADDTRAQLRESTHDQMREAQTWPMFGALAADETLTPFQQEVLDELQKDSAAAESRGRRPTMTMRQAYLEVENRYKSADYDAVYERALKAVGQAPKGTAVPRSGGGTPGVIAPASTSDIASRTLARLERGGA